MHTLLQTVTTRLKKMLRRLGGLIEEIGQSYMYMADPEVDLEEARALRPLQAAAVT